ncbi:MAG: VOC family protein [Pseudomonadota bacterium]
MKDLPNADIVPHQILYTMLRVTDLGASIVFYRDGLGMSELRRETFPEGRFTLIFMGYDDDPEGPTIELTWNWETETYSSGTGFGHIALAVRDIYGACARQAEMGVKIIRDPEPMTHAPEETGMREEIAFLTDPDDYKIELIGHAK